MMDPEDCRLPRDELIRKENDPQLDVPTALIHQPHLYELAAYLAQRSETNKIIHIGGGPENSLKEIENSFDITCIDRRSCLDVTGSILPDAGLVEANLEDGLPDINRELFDDAVVICADEIARLRNPEILVQHLSEIEPRCRYMLISTPDRTRASRYFENGRLPNPAQLQEWSADEFGRFLKDCKFPDRFFLGHTVNNDHQLNKTITLAIAGNETRTPVKGNKASVAAIINTYNEEDIIEEVAGYLTNQGVDVHIIDNWSDDRTYSLACALKERGLCTSVQRFPDTPDPNYQWFKQLENASDFARTLSTDWIMHHDADEIRCAPWPDVSLAEAFQHVDDLGYNAVAFTILYFRYIHDNLNIGPPYQDSLPFFEFGKAPGDFRQLKAWKNNGEAVDLASSGGHMVEFPGRRIFPYKFLTKHYPLRSKAQAEKKIFRDRLPRFRKENKEKGWHVQYDYYRDAESLDGWDAQSLISWQDNCFHSEYLVERLSGIGLPRDVDYNLMPHFDDAKK